MESTLAQPRSAGDYTVACICPMGVELAAVEGMLDEIHPPLPLTRDENAYTLGRIGQHNIVVAILPEIGNSRAATVAVQLVNDFSAVRFALLVGVGGGIPCEEKEDEEEDGDHDVRLGDVVVSQAKDTFGGVVQYDLGKNLADGTFMKTGHLNKPPAVLAANVRRLQARHLREASQITEYLSEMLQKWPKMKSKFTMPDPHISLDQLFRTSYPHQSGRDCNLCTAGEVRSRPERENREPHIHYGTIGSANTVVKNAVLRDKLKKDMGILCVEMEAAGLMDSFPGLVIRGICDYADSHKNKKWQPYAAAVAAAYMKELLMVIPVESVMQATNARQILVEDQKTHGILSKLLRIEEQKLQQSEQQSQENASSIRNEERNRCHRIFKTTDYNGQKNRNPLRLKDTCQWVLKHDLFQRWCHNELGTLLWISADPGCGKSVLARSLIDNDLNTVDQTVTICYFFFKDIEEQARLATALCAVLHQLFDQQPHLLDHAMAAHSKNGDRIREEPQTLWQILQASMADVSAQPITCVLDALDECRDDDRKQLISWLCDLNGHPSSKKHKFLVTSRPDDNVQRWFLGTSNTHLVKHVANIRLRGEEKNDQIEQEINLVVNHTVNSLATEFELSQDTCRRLREGLLQMQHRTYLWLYLSTEAIRDAIRLHRDQIEIEEILPKDVEDAYEKILRKVKPAFKPTSRQVLLIVLGARRALSIDEMAVALNTSRRLAGSKAPTVHADHLRKHIRDWCGLFIFINHSKLYLIHQTAKSFLLAAEVDFELARPMQSSDWRSSFTNVEVEDEMARCCIEYLFQMSHKTQVDATAPFFEYCAENWLRHFRDDMTIGNSYLLGQVLSLYDVQSKLYQLWFPVMYNAKRFYRGHYAPIWLDQHLAAFCGHSRLLKIFQGRNKFDVDAIDIKLGRSALHLASSEGHTETVQLLLDAQASIDIQGDFGQTALHYASQSGHAEMVQLLLDKQASIDIQGKFGETALHHASFRGHAEIVQLLLDKQASTDIPDMHGETAAAWHREKVSQQ